jgi:putative transcriptional regulator
MKKLPRSQAKLFNCVAKVRESLGFSQTTLAERTGITRGNLHKIETGKVIPSVLNALQIARTLQTQVNDLFSAEPLLSPSEKFELELKEMLRQENRLYED